MAERAIEATKELERELGLKQVEYKKSGDRRVKIGEYKQMERTGELSVMTEAKFVIDEVLKNQPTTEEFVVSLQNFGFDVKPNISEKTGRMNGFSFKKGELKFKSSAIAKNYSWQNLQKNGLDYKHERDTEFLIGVKNEFTEKLNLESGRDRGTETSESIVIQAESVADRTKSMAGEGTRSEIAEVKNRIAGNPNLSAKPEFIEVHDNSSALASAKQSDETKISDRAIFENGYRQKPQRNAADARENSGIAESKDGFAAIDISISTPKLNPAPNREADKTNSQSRKQEINYEKGRSR